MRDRDASTEHTAAGSEGERTSEYAKSNEFVSCGPNGVRDTSPTAEAYLVEGYRRMSPREKMARVRALNMAVLALAETDVRRRYPRADQREIDLRVASRWLDAETMRRVFGWDVEREGL